MPDLQSVENTKAIIKELETSDSNNLIIVLISGGGSALLCCPADGVTLDEKVHLTRLVAGAGATIQELNKCRIMFSQVKGGKLVQLAYPSKVIRIYVQGICLSMRIKGHPGIHFQLSIKMTPNSDLVIKCSSYKDLCIKFIIQ